MKSKNQTTKPKAKHTAFETATNLIDSDAEFAAVTRANKTNGATLPAYLQTLLSGSGVGVDENQAYPFPRPDWLDAEKLRRGQAFVARHLFGVMFATLVSIVFSFTSRDIIQPIVFSGGSDTPFKAFKRYLSTVTRVRSWYAGDLWAEGDEAHRNMKVVRGMHRRIKKTLTNTTEEAIAKKGTNQGKPMWTDLHQELLQDFKSCPPLETPTVGPKQVHVNQADMAITQFGFLGLFILYPQMFGVHNATPEDLEGFTHLWRGIGYLLGIEDQYNLCTGSLEEVRQKCRDLLDFWMIPLLRYVSGDWVHMGRCMTEGFSYYSRGVSFEVTIMYLCRVLRVETPRLAKALSFKQKCNYYLMIFLMKYLMRLPGAMRLLSWLSTMSLARARKGSPEFLQELEDRVYPYETQGMCPVG